MKKLLLLLFGIMSSLLMGENEKSVNVQVTARVIKPIEVVNKKDVEFGTIVVGQENVKAKSNGFITFSGEEKIKVSWKAEDGHGFNKINDPIVVTIANGENEIKTLISTEEVSNGVLNLNGTQETIVFSGKIDKVPEVAPGSYSGNFTVRAEYID
ncbi:hypothetical protein [uncultured Fusobacterium sp.]|uniref:hypothetical protein n=1 Tax=uncultured Fusobacterium sp. TaxID=159267 RepID=UPI0025FADE49|nr:hypothetical protein [uncultured Fusobacterium sp.]